MDSVLNNFNQISLDDIQKVQLMKRVDSKFVLHKNQLLDFLGIVSNSYDVLNIAGYKYQPYDTYYYDTSDSHMYNMHHNGKKNRFKIRFRKYKNSNESYLEIKHKNNKSQTIKNRIKTENTEFLYTEKEYKFIKKNSIYELENIDFKLSNSFNRITLAHKNYTERITIDNDIVFISKENKKIELNNISIIEIKQTKFNLNSEFMQLLKKNNIRALSISKYCTAMMLFSPELKNNNFKNKMIFLNKLSNC